MPATDNQDALVLAGGITSGAAGTGSSFTFHYLSAVSPGTQPFVILAPVSSIELDGSSTQVSAAPKVIPAAAPTAFQGAGTSK